MRNDVADVRLPNRPSLPYGGDVVGTMPDPPIQLWPDKHGHSAFFLPEWKAVMSAWRADPLLAAHLDKLVGPAGMRYPVVQQELGFSFWPSPRLAGFWRSGEDPEEIREVEFEKLYSPIANFFAADHRDIIVLIPLSGLIIDGALELEDDVVIDRFTREELQLLIDRGIIRDRFGGFLSTDNAPEAMRHGLRRTVTVPKIIGDLENIDEGDESLRLVSLPNIDRVRILRTLGCCLDGDLVPQPFVGRTAGWNPGGFVRTAASPILPYSGWGIMKTHLTKNDHESVKHVWRLLGSRDFEESGSLQIAVDRLAWRGTRSTYVDKLVDIAIASEAFFRSGEPERGPAGAAARVKQRASEFIDARDYSMNAGHVREFFHQASLVRNAVVHRGEHPENVPDAQFGSLEFAEFVERYIGLVRRAVLKHLMSQETPLSPVWSELP